METALAVLVELFVSAKQIEGRTPKTTSWYGNMLARFVAFMELDLNSAPCLLRMPGALWPNSNQGQCATPTIPFLPRRLAPCLPIPFPAMSGL